MFIDSDSLGLHCLSQLVCQARSVRNARAFTVNEMFIDSDNMSINPYCAKKFYICTLLPNFYPIYSNDIPVTGMYLQG